MRSVVIRRDDDRLWRRLLLLLLIRLLRIVRGVPIVFRSPVRVQELLQSGGGLSIFNE